MSSSKTKKMSMNNTNVGSSNCNGLNLTTNVGINGVARLTSRDRSTHHHNPPRTGDCSRSPRKHKDPSPNHYRRSNNKRLNNCEDPAEQTQPQQRIESPHRRKRTTSSSGRSQNNIINMKQHSQYTSNINSSRIETTTSPHQRTRHRRQSEGGINNPHQEEELVFWKPNEPVKLSSRLGGSALQYRNSPSKIPIPNKPAATSNPNRNLNGGNSRPNRPKMGVPVMTSTPRLLFGAPPAPKKEEPINGPSSHHTEDEPIYCEIGESGEAGLKKKARSESADMFYHNSSLNRNECEGKRSGHRQSLADFSVKMTARNPLTASPLLSQRQSLMASDVGLLGRRAATQFDFFGGSSISTPAATTILSEYRNELPPKSIYNHMSGIPYSQPPQRRFIPGLNGINGYCSDNDFCSLANESIASSSLPGQATGDISEINVNPGSTLKKGLLWQQRDKLFSRWKERFFILTKDYLQCFRRGSSRISEMGAFIFRIKLIEVEEVEIIDKRGYLTISLSMGKDGKVLLRKPDGIRDWFNILKECVSTCKERKGMMKSSKEFWSKKQFTDSSSMEQYIMARHRIGHCTGRPQYGYYVENESFPFDSNALPNHLRMKLKGCMNQISPAQGNISTNNLKHYGYIDVPRSSFRSSEGDDKVQLQSLCTDLYLKGNVRDYPSEYSHDSGVDSMNTNSSGSVMSGSITSPMMNRPSKFVFKSPEEDPLSLMHGKHLKPTTERDRKISLV